MEILQNFFNENGWVITVIALAGVMLLGILKYCNLFGRVEEKSRHLLYLLISIGFSAIGSGIYLGVTDTFDMGSMCAVTGAISALNQTFYNVFKTTELNDLIVKILDYILSRKPLNAK